MADPGQNRKIIDTIVAGSALNSGLGKTETWFRFEHRKAPRPSSG